jgi:hypothetical protein
MVGLQWISCLVKSSCGRPVLLLLLLLWLLWGAVWGGGRSGAILTTSHYTATSLEVEDQGVPTGEDLVLGQLMGHPIGGELPDLEDGISNL